MALNWASICPQVVNNPAWCGAELGKYKDSQIKRNDYDSLKKECEFGKIITMLRRDN